MSSIPAARSAPIARALRYAEIVTTWASAPRKVKVSGGSQSVSMNASSQPTRSRISRTTARHSGAIRATADRCGPVLLLIHQSMQQLAQRSLADLGHIGVAEHEWSVEDRVAHVR